MQPDSWRSVGTGITSHVHGWFQVISTGISRLPVPQSAPLQAEKQRHVFKNCHHQPYTVYQGGKQLVQPRHGLRSLSVQPGAYISCKTLNTESGHRQFLRASQVDKAKRAAHHVMAGQGTEQTDSCTRVLDVCLH